MPQRPIQILGVPLDLGQRRRGVDMGPSAIRAAGLQTRLRALGRSVEDAGDLPVVIPETQPSGGDQARYLAEIAAVCRRVAKRVSEYLERGRTPIVLGGDHSLAVGSVAGTARFFRRAKQPAGLLWLDAHADCNTPESTPSGNVHGMPLAACLGLGPPELTRLLSFSPLVDAQYVALVGVHDVDPSEKQNIRKAGIKAFTVRDIDERGMQAVMREALAIVSRASGGFHVSFDMDLIDPTDAPGVGTPVRGGVSYREAHLAMEMIADSGGLRALDIVETNPILDVHNQTGTLAVELALSAFGKRIL